MTTLDAAGYGAAAYLITRGISTLVKWGRGPEGWNIRVYPVTMALWACLGAAAFFFLASPASAGYKECEYDNSKTVVSRLSGLEGMVVAHWRADPDELIPRNCRYDVRFVTDTGWVYTIEKMVPYEIRWPTEKPTVAPPSTPAKSLVEGLDFGG